MTSTIASTSTRRVTGGLLVLGALAFAAAATTLSATFDWPAILRKPAAVALPTFVAGGTSLVWTWFATAWTYAILLVPILLLPATLGRRSDPVLRVATYLGATSVVLSVVGFLRWVFVVPPLAAAYVTATPPRGPRRSAAWTAQHQFGGALLGEHLGQLLAVAWSGCLCVVILRTRVLPRWLGGGARGRARCTSSTRATSWPPPSPASRSGTCRSARQLRLGTVDRGPGGCPPPAPRPSAGAALEDDVLGTSSTVPTPRPPATTRVQQ